MLIGVLDYKHEMQQDVPTSALLTFQNVSSIILCYVGALRCIFSILAASLTPSYWMPVAPPSLPLHRLGQPKMSLDIVECPVVCKIHPH